MNWARREQVVSLSDLVRRAPSALMEERNLGRKSVRQARELIEGATGHRWEVLFERQVEPAAAPRDTSLKTPSGEVKPWDTLRLAFTDEQRELELQYFPLAKRMQGLVEITRLRTLGDLAELSRAQLIESPNLGRGSVDALPALIVDHIETAAAAYALADEGLLECFKVVVDALEPAHRTIAMRRSGLSGEPATLQELGETFGVTRERIRQMEIKVGEKLRRQPWVAEARRRVDAAMVGGAASLQALASDRWWAAATTQPDTVAFVVGTVLGLGLQVTEFGGSDWITKESAQTLSRSFSALMREADNLPLPSAFAPFRELAAKHAASFGPVLASAFEAELRGRLTFVGDPATNSAVVAIGSSLAEKAMAILRSAPAPLHIDEVERMTQRRFTHASDEVIHFGRGLIGVRSHIPDFDEWQRKLVPEMASLMSGLGPDRQWHCAELLDELREAHDLPDWLTPYGLAAFAKGREDVRYLGRQRVALPNVADTDQRIYVYEAVEAILEAAGMPLTKADLFERLKTRMGMSQHGVTVIFQPQFVRLDGDRVGLMTRDVPGGTDAIAEAASHLEAVLARRGRGISDFHAQVEVSGLSRAHAQWCVPLTLSVVRADGRFRISQAGAIGHAAWESVRMPTRLNLFGSALQESGGHVSVEAVLARIEAHYGTRPSRNALFGFATSVGASLDGDWILKRTAKPGLSADPTSRTTHHSGLQSPEQS